jgi:peptidoglycan/LPS O-acetylase OafA/YrhL
LRTPWRAFVRNRALRIYPGLLACLVFTTFVLGPACSSLDVAEYITNWRSWAYLLNALFFPLQNSLPGVFAGNPWADAVNGSLWTLAIEVTAYAIILLACLSGRGPAALRVTAFAAGSAAFLAYATLSDTFYLIYLQAEFDGTSIFLIYLSKIGLARLLLVFAVGASMNWLRRSDGEIAVGFLLIAAGLLAAWSMGLIWPLALAVAFTTVAIGRDGGFGGWTFDDLSYGLYLYHVPVFQAARQAMQDWAPVTAQICVGLLATAVMAVLSWRLVEKPALRLKRGINRASP